MHEMHSILFKIFLENERCSQVLKETYKNHKTCVK